MSLFGSLQMAANSLQANQIGLQVVSQNIANANTPGYAREEVIFTPAPAQKIGTLQLGLGVRVDAVVQIVDTFLEQRMRTAGSDLASAATQEQAYQQLEGLLGELKDTDLSTSLNQFYNSISEVLNQPESVSARNLAVQRGKALVNEFNQVATRVGELVDDVNTRIIGSADDINRLLEEIRSLNVRITTTEGGDVSKSDAVGLRDQRRVALESLANLIDIRVEEQVSGSVNVFAGGDYLVFEGSSREVHAVVDTERADNSVTVRIKQTDSQVGKAAGELHGLVKTRDEILGGFLSGLDSIAKTLAFEFNKIYSSGQGLNGYRSMTGENTVLPPDTVLDQAGLPSPPVNGSFQVKILNRQTGLSTTTDIPVDLNGLDGNDTTLASLAASLDAVSGLTASVGPDGKLTLTSDSSNLEFAFADDSSGVLAALGLGTFFTGSTAANLGIYRAVVADPSLFAASRSGIGGDTANAEQLAHFGETPLDSAGGKTLTEVYETFVGQTTQGAALAHSVAEGLRTFHNTLQGQQLAISGVSVDEETIKLLNFQHAYQASARFVATVNELLDTLIRI